MRPASIAWYRNGKIVKKLKSKPKEKWIFVNKKSEGTKQRTECCAEADMYRCMRCGRGSKDMKMPVYRTKIVVKKCGKMGKAPSGRS